MMIMREKNTGFSSAGAGGGSNDLILGEKRIGLKEKLNQLCNIWHWQPSIHKAG